MIWEPNINLVRRVMRSSWNDLAALPQRINLSTQIEYDQIYPVKFIREFLSRSHSDDLDPRDELDDRLEMMLAHARHEEHITGKRMDLPYDGAEWSPPE